MTTTLSRARGCLLGQLAGDSLGSLVEFRTPESIAAQYGDEAGPRLLEEGGAWGTLPGQPTDDGEMALTLARLLAHTGSYAPRSALGAYQTWLASRPFCAGATTRAALARPNGALPGGRSQTNGSLMRISPLGIWGARVGAARAVEAARQDSRLTHPHPVCVESCAAFVAALANLVRGGGHRDAWSAAFVTAKDETVRAALLGAQAGKKPAGFITCQDGALTALHNAFYRLLHADSFEEGVVATVREGGDTDTNGAIAGALLGARWGEEAVPAQWREAILSCRPGDSPCRHPRPPRYWPTDALTLADRIMNGPTDG